MYALLLTVTLAANPAQPVAEEHSDSAAPSAATASGAAPQPGSSEVIAEVRVEPAHQGPFGGFFRRMFQRKSAIPAAVRPASDEQSEGLFRHYFNSLYEESSEAQKRWETSRFSSPD